MTQGPYDVRRCICECDPLSPAKKKRDCAPKKKMNEAMAKLSHEKEKKKKKRKRLTI